MQVKSLVNDYYSSFDFNQLRDITKKQYEYHLNLMMATEINNVPFEERNLSNIKTKDAKVAYNLWCEKGVSLANHVLSSTRIVFNHGMRMEMCLTNPFSNIRKRSTERRKVVWSREHIQRFLDVAYGAYESRSIGLIAHMAYEWCQRVGDMRMLTWDNIDFDKQELHLEQSKRRADVHLPISDDLCDMLSQQHDDFGFQPYVAPRPRPVKGEYIPYSLHKLPLMARRIMDCANLPQELRLSDLRRTGTTEMVEAGVGIGQIMSVTGHANPASVTPYLKNTLKSANYALTERNKHGKSISTAAKESDIT